MTIKEFKKWLDQFPEGTEVEVPSLEEGTSWQPDVTHFKKFEGESYVDFEFIDFTKNQFVKEDHPYFGKVVLQLGETT